MQWHPLNSSCCLKHILRFRWKDFGWRFQYGRKCTRSLKDSDYTKSKVELERGLSGKSRPFLTANPGFLSFTPRDPGWNRYLQIIPRRLVLKSSSWDFPDYQSSTLNHYCIHQSFVGIVIYLKVILNINSIRSNITWRFIIQHNSGSFIPKYLRT